MANKIISTSVLKDVVEPGWAQFMVDSAKEGSLAWAGSRFIQRISAAQAMRQSVVSGALDIVAQDIGKIPFGLVRETRSSVVFLDQSDHPWARKCALDPSRHQTWVRFWLQLIPILVLRQEAVIYKRRNSKIDTEPDLIPLEHSEWEQTSDTKDFSYNVSATDLGRQTLLGWGYQSLSSDDVVHIIMRSMNGYEGLSTLSIGADVFGLNAMAIDFQAALVKGGTRPTGVIQVPELMTDESFTRLKEQIFAALRDATDQGRPLILEQDAEFKSIGLDAHQTDMVSARTLLAKEAARVLRMPPHKLGMTEDLNRANVDAIEKAYVDDTLVPICEVIEQEFTRSFLTTKERLQGLKYAFDRVALYDRDPVARRAGIEGQFKAGLTFLNEARAALSLPAVPDNEDHRCVPVNTAQVFRDGRVQIFTSKPGGSGNETDSTQADPDANGATRGIRLAVSNH